MTAQYRTTRPPCPLCGNLLEDRAAADAVVDVCTECQAVWIDWFDGDVVTVASDVQVSKAIPVRSSNQAACPRCLTDLVSERFRATGPYVFRCPDCSGVLIPSAVFHEIVGLGPPATLEQADQPGLFDRVLARLERIFGSSS